MSVKLVELNINDIGCISSLSSKIFDVHRLIDMGLTKGSKIRLINKTPNKGPIEIKIRDYYIAVRYSLASSILVEIE